MRGKHRFELGPWSSPGSAHRSLWLEQALAMEAETLGDEARRLDGSLSCDVCIVGGGYAGLWTAIRLREADPGCHVVLLEADICGGGASGRNGGIALGWWVKFPALAAYYGQEIALQLCRESSSAVQEIGTFTREHGIDCHFAPGGWVWGATSEAQSQNRVWAGVVRAVEAAGCEDVFVELDADDLSRRMGTPSAFGGVLDSTGATVHPALLARGLRRAAREAGVDIREQSPVTSIRVDRRTYIASSTGQVDAERTILTTNAWIARLPAFRRSCVPISSDVVATEPIPSHLTDLGWEGHEAVSNQRMMVNYYRPTRDHRLVLGRGGGTVAFAGRIGDAFSHSPDYCRKAAADLYALMPSLRGTSITHSWSGPIDRSASGMPWFGRLDPTGKVLFGVGFSGNGVAPSLLAGRILASLALEQDNDWARSPLISAGKNGFPPEPIRYFGGVLIRSAVGRKETAEARGGRGTLIDRKLASLAPAGVYAVDD